jgi:hypothetical protein
MAVAAESSADADCVIVRIPTVEQLGAEIEALQKEGAGLPDDQDALLDHLAKLRELAVYLNVHLVAPAIPEA